MNFDQHQDHLSITWETGEVSRFHWIWLRDSCQSAAVFNAHCKQKYVDPASIPADIRPSALWREGEDIVITWPDGHVSHYDAAWLKSHDYSRAPASRLAAPVGERAHWRPWTEMTVQRMAFAHDAVMGDDAALRDALEILFDYGFIRITGEGGAPRFEALCERLAGFVERSYFGDFFDLKTKRDDETDSISFSTKPLPLHTDIPYYRRPPDYQFLFGLQVNAEAEGHGRTLFVDGLAVAQRLKAEAPRAFELLATMPVTYRAEYPWAGKTYLNRTTIIQRDAAGDIVRLFNNPSKMFFEDISFDDMLPLYRAYAVFKDMLRKASFVYEHAWRQGDMIVFDNRRIFHGRDGFDRPAVTRTLRGGYFNEVELMARHAYLCAVAGAGD